jgi:hypothetical protein
MSSRLHPLVLPLALTPLDRERLLLHIQILRERAAGHPTEAAELYRLCAVFRKMLNEDEAQQEAGAPSQRRPTWSKEMGERRKQPRSGPTQPLQESRWFSSPGPATDRQRAQAPQRL